MSVTHTKNRILQTLNEADSPQSLLETGRNILSVLRMTRELWAECGYSYKAKEICERICRECEGFLTFENLHHDTQRVLDSLRVECYNEAAEFNRDQMSLFSYKG